MSLAAALRRHLLGPALFTLLCLALAGAYSWQASPSVPLLLGQLWVVVVLAVLEVSLSFDNAVVNAALLADMDAVWRKRFLTWGMVFAVFGTRILFPLAIVGLSAGLDPVAAVRLSLTEPARYEEIVTAAHLPIAGFGGAFLALVGLRFFLDQGKQRHWLRWLERPLHGLGRVEAAAIALVLAALLAGGAWLAPQDAHGWLTGGIVGIITFVLVEALGNLLGAGDGGHGATVAVARSGLGAFLYLNVLDASFSLDGVIGAFALSNNMVIIALGLSIGAAFVRALTLILVERDVLGQLVFLEHGAFWAILALAGIMLSAPLVEVPESITGLVGAGLIAVAFWQSLRLRQRGGA